MPDILFGADDKVTFPTKYHGDVTLSKQKWDKICGQEERYYYRHNGDKISTTLIAPDFVRHHKDISTQFFYYKAFDRIAISEYVQGPTIQKLMAVVIDTATQRVCTVYPTDAPKSGSKEYKPEEPA